MKSFSRRSSLFGHPARWRQRSRIHRRTYRPLTELLEERLAPAIHQWIGRM